MRTTVNLDDDVAAAVERLRIAADLGFSEAVNRLARAGAAVVDGGSVRTKFVQQTVDLRGMADVSNVAEALEAAELDG